MSDHAFDDAVRRAAVAVSRRRSLLALGGAAVAESLAGPLTAGAKKGGKGKDRCTSQVGKCREGIADLCAIFFDEAEELAECEGVLSPCCRFLEECETAKAFACAVEKLEAKKM